EHPYKGGIIANGTCSPPWYISPEYMLDGGCALLTRPGVMVVFVYWRVRCAYPPYKILGITFNVGWVSEAHPPFFYPATKRSVVMVLFRLKKNRPIRADFPPGAGIAKGAAASPLCTFA
ncbi:hypothetical protein ACN5L3_001453, partial [Cronobacter malonaticus]